ncbi:MAG: prenyltransferase/squalene oxidase repeat-containing protein [Phycisphaerales bacterium]
MSEPPLPRKVLAAAALVAGGLFCVFVAAACERHPVDRADRIERALDGATRYLAVRQSEDGAWRSETYGALTDGVTLTPPILKTLWLSPPSPETRAACARAAGYLRGFVAGDGTISPQTPLDYPVYSAAMAAIVFNRLLIDEPSDANRRARDAWLHYLRDYQVTDRLGWNRLDAGYGGWGYAVRPPQKPETGRLPFVADLSSTLFAVGALRLSGVPADDPALRAALGFVERCQNFSRDAAGRDAGFDDGGFFFTAANRAQNKAGVSGTDRNGVIRYHSYGSATADGVRALIRCGLAPDHPRVLAAQDWLQRNFSTRTNPGVFEPVLAADRDAALNYWCWSVSHALRLLSVTTVDRDGLEVAWAPWLADDLMSRQLPDGSWKNPHSFMKEDDPLIATTLAAAALANCREVILPSRMSAPSQ